MPAPPDAAFDKLCCKLAVNLFVAGQQGNVTERLTASVLSLLLTLAVLVGSLYLLLWQTYVLWLEAGLICVEMAFLAFEMVFASVSVITFARYDTYRTLLTYLPRIP